MPNALYYKSAHWRELRAQALKRADGKCEVPGCQTPHHRLTVDHINARPRDAIGPTAFDVLSNLRVLCGHHDAQIKERSGKRQRGGKLTVAGCDPAGRPLDPLHDWNKGRG